MTTTEHESAIGDQAKPSLRDRRTARTRQQIIDVATRMFRERGFESSTIEEIAAEVDISARTVYRYFPTKDSILFAELEDRLRRLPGALRARPADEAPAVSLFAALCESIADGSETFDLLRQQLSECPELEGYPSKAVAERVTQELRAILAERTGRPVDDLWLEVVTTTMATWCGLAMRRHLDRPDDATFAEQYFEVATIGFNGIGTPAELDACRVIAEAHVHQR